MVWSIKRRIQISEKQHNLLTEIIKSYTVTQAHKLRAQIILLAYKGYSQRAIEKELSINHELINYWKERWYSNQEVLSAYDQELKGKAYLEAVLKILSDLPRPGRRPKFTQEQICHIINVASEQPEDSDLPLSHWTLKELADELVRRKIVDSISTSQLSVFLKSSRDKTS